MPFPSGNRRGADSQRGGGFQPNFSSRGGGRGQERSFGKADIFEDRSDITKSIRKPPAANENKRDSGQFGRYSNSAQNNQRENQYERALHDFSKPGFQKGGRGFDTRTSQQFPPWAQNKQQGINSGFVNQAPSSNSFHKDLKSQTSVAPWLKNMSPNQDTSLHDMDMAYGDDHNSPINPVKFGLGNSFGNMNSSQQQPQQQQPLLWKSTSTLTSGNLPWNTSNNNNSITNNSRSSNRPTFLNNTNNTINNQQKQPFFGFKNQSQGLNMSTTTSFAGAASSGVSGHQNTLQSLDSNFRTSLTSSNNQVTLDIDLDFEGNINNNSNNNHSNNAGSESTPPSLSSTSTSLLTTTTTTSSSQLARHTLPSSSKQEPEPTSLSRAIRDFLPFEDNCRDFKAFSEDQPPLTVFDGILSSGGTFIMGYIPVTPPTFGDHS